MKINYYLIHKYFIAALLMLLSFKISSAEVRDFNDTIVPDTIDYNRTRLFLEAPLLSIKSSTLNYGAEGFAILYPFVSPSGKTCCLCIDDVRMQELKFLHENDFDKELWNTFDQENIGSISYVKNGLYYRYDRFLDGLIIYYEEVPEDMREVLEKVMKSIKKSPQKPDDKPLDRNKRRKYDMDNHELYPSFRSKVKSSSPDSYIGTYIGKDVRLELHSNNKVVFNLKKHPSGISENGHWVEYDDYIIVEFPLKTPKYFENQIESALSDRYEACTIILEKKGKDSLLWRNKEKLKKTSK